MCSHIVTNETGINNNATVPIVPQSNFAISSNLKNIKLSGSFGINKLKLIKLDILILSGEKIFINALKSTTLK